jgi:hypothetical protein
MRSSLRVRLPQLLALVLPVLAAFVETGRRWHP